MITVEELMELFSDPDRQQVNIRDWRTEHVSTVYQGFYGEIPVELKNRKIQEIDNLVNFFGPPTEILTIVIE